MERRYSPRTVSLYIGYITEFYDFIGPVEGESEKDFISVSTMRSFIAAEFDSGLSSRTINLKLSALSSYADFLVKHGVVERNPLKRVQRPKESKRLPEFYTLKAMDNYFVRETDSEDILSYRDRMVVITIYATGIRRAELANLRIDDWDRSRSLFRITGKGDKMREVPVPDYLNMELARYLDVLKEYYPENMGGYFFLTDAGQRMYLSFVNKIVKRELEGVEGLVGRKSPHLLRHSLATHLLNNGADLNSIKEVLGHSSLAATQVYTHNSFEQLKKVFLTAHPRAKKGG